MPIVINLFEGDDSGSFRKELEAVGAAVGEYDPALHFYRAVAKNALAVGNAVGTNSVVETAEANNCRPSGTTMTVTP